MIGTDCRHQPQEDCHPNGPNKQLVLDMLDKVVHGTEKDIAKPKTKVDSTRHPGSLLPRRICRSEDMGNLRGPKDEESGVDAAKNCGYDIDASETSDISE